MTATASCECGYRKTSRTQGLAEHGLRLHSCDRHRALAERRERGEQVRAAREANRTAKPCPHNGRHRHGTHACYVLDRCRCRPCADAASAYERRRTRQTAYGRSYTVDAEPVRAHVRALTAHGMGWKRIADAASVSHGAMTKLLYGDTKRGMPPSRRLRRATADRLLAVEVTLSGGVMVDATRTRELAQAMMARGYSLTWICEQVGITNQRLLYRQRVRLSTQRAVEALVDLCATTPGPCERSRRTAARNGWTPAALWEVAEVTTLRSQDDVDPVVVERIADGERTSATIAERYAAYALMRDRGVGASTIQERLHVNSQRLREYANRYDNAVPVQRGEQVSA